MWRAGITYVAPSSYVAPSTGQTDHITGPTTGPTTGTTTRSASYQTVGVKTPPPRARGALFIYMRGHEQRQRARGAEGRFYGTQGGLFLRLKLSATYRNLAQLTETSRNLEKLRATYGNLE